VCSLWGDEAFCRSSLVHELSGNCGAMRRLRPCTASSRKRWRAHAPGPPRNELSCS